MEMHVNVVDSCLSVTCTCTWCIVMICIQINHVCLYTTVGLITTLVHVCSIVSSVPWWSFIRVMGLSLFVNYFVLQRSMLLPLCSLMR